jgi:hypothetical protein
MGCTDRLVLDGVESVTKRLDPSLSSSFGRATSQGGRLLPHFVVASAADILFRTRRASSPHEPDTPIKIPINTRKNALYLILWVFMGIFMGV